MTKLNIKVIGSGICALAAVGLVTCATVLPVGAATITHSSSASGTQLVFIMPGSEITLDTDTTGVTAGVLDALEINVSTGSGVSTQKLTASTNDADGFSLAISGGGNLVSSDVSDFVKNVSPAAILADDEWGFVAYRNYAVGTHDGTASYVAGVTTAAGNTTPIIASSTFYNVPFTSSLLAKTTNNGKAEVWLNYGAKISSTLPTGTVYGRVVTYTASINP